MNATIDVLIDKETDMKREEIIIKPKERFENLFKIYEREGIIFTNQGKEFVQTKKAALNGQPFFCM